MPTGIARDVNNTNAVYLAGGWTSYSAYSSQAGGGSCTVLSYNVQRNQGNNTVSANDVWTDVQGQVGNLNTGTWFQTSTGIIAGTTYKIRVRANNKYGWTAYSSVVTMRAACPPNPPSTITLTNNTIYMNIAWTIPVNNGADLTSYSI